MSPRTFGLLLLAASTALADIAPPDVGGCADKAVGAACQRDDGSAGACTEATCTRNDYSNGPPPKHIEVACLKCLPVPVAAAAPAPPKKSDSCAAVPGLSLGALAVLLARRRARA